MNVTGSYMSIVGVDRAPVFSVRADRGEIGKWEILADDRIVADGIDRYEEGLHHVQNLIEWVNSVRHQGGLDAAMVYSSLADPDAGKTDWPAVTALSDEDIAKAVAEDPDAAPIMDPTWIMEAAKALPAKQQITLRIDEDVIAFFRTQGDGYQTRMNAVLRAFMEHAKRSK